LTVYSASGQWACTSLPRVVSEPQTALAAGRNDGGTARRAGGVATPNTPNTVPHADLRGRPAAPTDLLSPIRFGRLDELPCSVTRRGASVTPTFVVAGPPGAC